MKTSLKNKGNSRIDVRIDVPSEDIDAEYNEALKVYTKHANISGFRKGKAPKNVVENKYLKQIKEDVKERILPKYYQKAIKENDLKVVNVIGCSDINITLGNSTAFTITIDVVPEFKLPKYEGITINTKKEVVTESQINEQISIILNQHATYDEIEDKIIEEGDMGQISYEAFLNEKPLKDEIPEAKGLGSGKDYWISADEHAFIPGMGKALIGLKKGDSKKIDVEFPEGFMIKELGKVKARYHVNITGVKVKKEATLTEELLNKLQVESESQLKQIIREQLENQAENKELEEKHKQIISYLIKKTKIEVPESAVQQQTREVMYDIARQRMMMGMNQDQLSENQDELLKEAQERALENVKLRYIGLSIADEQKFKAEQNEINKEIEQIAIQQRKDVGSIRKEMMENNTLDSVSDQIRFNKVLNYLVENAKNK